MDTETIRPDHDNMVERNRKLRWGVLGATIIVVLLIPTSFGFATGNVLSFAGSNFLFSGIGFAVGVYLVGKAFPRFWVLVPQTTAFVTTNAFSKDGDPNIPYGPGAHPSFPWEQRAESGNITLDVLTIGFTETVPTKTTAVKVDGSVQFKFDLAHATTVVSLDKATIVQGFVDIVKSWISTRLAEETGELARKKVTKIRDEIEEHFKDKIKEYLLKNYAIRVVSIPISGIDFSADVQKVRDATDEAKQAAKGVAFLLGFSSIKAMNEAIEKGVITQVEVSRARDDFLASSGNVKKEVRRVDVTGVDGVGGAVAAGLLGGGK